MSRSPFVAAALGEGEEAEVVTPEQGDCARGGRP
jgi:hypothetical protein